MPTTTLDWFCFMCVISTELLGTTISMIFHTYLNLSGLIHWGDRRGSGAKGLKILTWGWSISYCLFHFLWQVQVRGNVYTHDTKLLGAMSDRQDWALWLPVCTPYLENIPAKMMGCPKRPILKCESLNQLLFTTKDRSLLAAVGPQQEIHNGIQ